MLKLYNTLTQGVEPFEPAGQPVTLYVCGITPYDTTHLGHAFTYTTADVLVRYLEYHGHQVRYVQNVTDIDDDILKKAAEVGEDWQSLVNRWTAHFIEDMQALNVRPPDRLPRATSVIQEIQDTVTRLLERGVAYEAGGSVYFDISRWDEFGKLSKLPGDQMLPVANQRGNRPDDPHKRNPLDFVLWQARAGDEPSWDSPWGPGRPGWHIECSTLSTCMLGETVDLHMGGADLVFPHHEAEIAQVEPLNEDQPFVRTWMHVAMVSYKGEKMSKSLGNLVMVDDLLKTYSPDALRLYLASHHYRDAWEYEEGDLEAYVELAAKLEAAARATLLEEPGGLITVGEVPMDGTVLGRHRKAFEEAMDDNLDTPSAVRVLGELAGQVMGDILTTKDVSKGQELLRELARVFGLLLGPEGPEERVVSGWQAHLKDFGGQ
jgi:cysteinyl-tRNA synthetase